MNEKEQLLQDIWSELDSTKKGFIYGRDLSKFIDKILNAIDNKEKIDKDKLNIINSFAKEQAFTKIYKVVLDDILMKLIGLTYDDIIGKSKILIDLPSHTKESSVLENSNIPNTTDNHEVELLKKELSHKNQIIESKELELVELQKNVSIYKEKFNHLVKEFNFYKQTIERKDIPRERKINLLDNSNNNQDQRKFDLRNEFFIDEFKRQISEQSKIINKLKDQIQNNPNLLSINSNSNKNQDYDKLNTWQRVPVFISKQFTSFLILITILGFFCSVYFHFTLINEAPGTTNDSSNWLDDNSLMNKVNWVVNQHDHTNHDDTIGRTLGDQDPEVYNVIFRTSGNQL